MLPKYCCHCIDVKCQVTFHWNTNMGVCWCVSLSVHVCVCCLPEIAVVTGFLGMLCVLPQ